MNRHPKLITADRSSLLIVDVQEKLVPVISNKEFLLKNLGKLLSAGKRLKIPIAISEQYPQGLGPTIATLKSECEYFEQPSSDRDRQISFFQKTTFSCRENQELFAQLLDSGLNQLIVAGIEAHICVLQTCLDLQHFGFDVSVVSDAIGSRNPAHVDSAITRLASVGIQALPTESVLFEWCESAQHPAFKQISKLIRS